MPIKKARLSRIEQAMHRTAIQELRDAGVDLDIEVGSPAENILCELPSGITAYAPLVKLIALRSNVRVEDCRIVSPWDLESIALCGSEGGLYGVRQGLSFTKDEALNPRIENGLHFHRYGEVAQGWLVASGFRPIPDQYRDRMIITLHLTFTDQFGREYSVQARALLDRSAALKNRVSRRGTKRGLFEVDGELQNEIRNREVPRTAVRNGPEQPDIHLPDRPTKNLAVL
jgi:hypothetical protein